MILNILILTMWALKASVTLHATDEPVVSFETDFVIIKIDTSTFFECIDENYFHCSGNDTHRQLIKSEVRYRLSVSANNEARMDGMNLNCYKDKQRRSYLGSCLNYNEPLIFMQTRQAKVYYKNSMKEISFKVKKVGSKFSGHIERLYIDKATDKAFYKEVVYKYAWWKPKEGRRY